MIAANGSIDTTEEATVYVQDLDIFVTVQLIEYTPAVLSVGNFREENGFSCGWEGQPHLVDHCKIAPCKCDNFVPIVVPVRSSEAHLTNSPEDSFENTQELTPDEQETSIMGAIFSSKVVCVPRFVVEVLCTEFLTVCGRDILCVPL